MNLADTRNIILVQAIEETDTGGRLFSDDEKRLAEAAAGAPLPDDSGKTRQNQFLADRAGNLIGTVESRLEGDRNWLRSSSFRSKFSQFALLTIVAAALFGYLTNELGPREKINILSFPLIGIIAWNLIVYLGELLVIFRREGAAAGLPGIVTRSLFPPPINQKKDELETSVEFRARSLFQSRWLHLNLNPLAARVKATLHFTALVLAAAAITGMYVKGLAREYNAAWESTFFETGDQLEPFLRGVLGPAAAVLNDTLPDGDHLDTLKLPETEGENAGRWIHWYAVTIAIYVLIPRLILGIIWHLRAIAMDRSLPFREVSPIYFERVLAISTGDSLGIEIIPYAHDPADGLREGIRTHMERIFERPVSISWRDTISFGDEDDAEVTVSANAQPMILFNFASTPERETHLALYRKLSSEENESTLPFQVILDCEAFDRKAESFADGDERRSSRWDAWRKLFAGEECEIHVVSDHAIDQKHTAHG